MGGEAKAMAEEGMKLFKQEAEVELDVSAATVFKEKIDAQMGVLDEEIKGLTGKDNKKARGEKEKEKKALKDGKEYIDAKKVLKGKQPVNGNFIIKSGGDPTPAPAAELANTDEHPAAAAAAKEKKEKPKKAMESTGISKAERDELEKLKNDIIARKKELKEGGMSGGQINKDETVAGWVARMNELKEKECPGSTAAGKKDDKKEGKKKLSAEAEAELAQLEKQIEEYRQKLVSEFGYSKKDIAADPDMVDMQAALQKLTGGKK